MVGVTSANSEWHHLQSVFMFYFGDGKCLFILGYIVFLNNFTNLINLNFKERLFSLLVSCLLPLTSPFGIGHTSNTQ